MATIRACSPRKRIPERDRARVLPSGLRPYRTDQCCPNAGDAQQSTKHDRIELVSAPDCGPLIERFLEKPAPEALSQAALEVLSIVAYEQHITRAEISHIRGTDSSGVIETLLARRLIEDDPRFGSRGRPSFLATTADFLCSLGLGSLAELPPRPVPSSHS